MKKYSKEDLLQPVTKGEFYEFVDFAKEHMVTKDDLSEVSADLAEHKSEFRAYQGRAFKHFASKDDIADIAGDVKEIKESTRLILTAMDTQVKRQVVEDEERAAESQRINRIEKHLGIQPNNSEAGA